MVYVTGDTHGNVWRFDEKYFPDQKEMTREDTVIVLGDFGCVWDKYSIAEIQKLDYLEEKPFTLCFVDGNHENFDRLYNEFETVDFHGGKAHKVRENIYHLMRGYIFDFDGKKFFAFGGASSHDIQDGILDRKNFKSDEDFLDAWDNMTVQGKMFRVNHFTWWKQELPDEREMVRGKQNLESVNYKVDYVITHCLPQTIASDMDYPEGDVLTAYFDDLINRGLQFYKWYCGHYHKNRAYSPQYEILYEDIARII